MRESVLWRRETEAQWEETRESLERIIMHKVKTLGKAPQQWLVTMQVLLRRSWTVLYVIDSKGGILVVFMFLRFVLVLVLSLSLYSSFTLLSALSLDVSFILVLVSIVSTVLILVLVLNFVFVLIHIRGLILIARPHPNLWCESCPCPYSLFLSLLLCFIVSQVLSLFLLLSYP